MISLDPIFRKKLLDTKGFTLIELAAVLLVAGLVMAAAAQAVKLYSVNQKHETSRENLKLAQEALNEYKGLMGRYPCPADPTLSPGDGDYGISKCRTSADVTSNPDDCTDGSSALGSLECIAGAGTLARDGDENGAPDVVLVGALPFRTLANTVVSSSFRETNRADGYGSLISYAVTEHMTNSNFTVVKPVNPWTGGIKVIDENKMDVTIPPGSAHYVVYSHGENQRAAYTRNGVKIGDCNVSTIVMVAGNPTTVSAPTAPGTGGAGNAGETENCDNNDAVFVQGIRMMVDNSNYNDDILYYKGIDDIPLWKRSLASPSNESYIYNTNLGAVGVGTDQPIEKLHILAGNLRIQAASLSPSYCDGSDDTICLNPVDLGGTGSQCADPEEVAYAIEGGKVVCRPVDWSSALGKTCGTIDVSGTPTQTYIRAISNEGTLLCCTQTANNCAEF